MKQQVPTILKNKENFLPISLREIKRIAVFGTLAKRVKIGEEKAYDFIEKIVNSKIEIKYTAGHLDTNEVNETVMNEAQRIANWADVVLIFVGFSEEGSIEQRVKLPTPQNVLVDVVSQVEKKVVVVVCANLEVPMPWEKQVKSILKIREGNREMVDLVFAR